MVINMSHDISLTDSCMVLLEKILSITVAEWSVTRLG